MKNSLYISLLFFMLSTLAWGQKDSTPKSKIYAGYGLFLNYNLYSWYKKPSSLVPLSGSSGQVLNVLPGLGLNFWLGDVDHWIVTVEGAIEYAPFAFNLENYQGMGALSIPVLAKAQFPIAKQQSLWLMLHIGAGVQFIQTEIYARPTAPINNFNPFFMTIVGEAGFHISAVGYHKQHIREVEFFIRGGGAPFGGISVNSGLRLTFMNRIGKK